MVQTVSEDGAFQEIALVGITKKSGIEGQFAAIIEDIEFDGGEKGIDQAVLVNGGRIVKRIPQTIKGVSLKIYPLSIDATNDKEDLIMQFFGGSYDVSAPLSQNTSHNWDLFRVTILFTEDSTVTIAASATTIGNFARRIIMKDSRIVSYTESFSDKVLSAQIKFQCPPFDRSNNALITHEGVDRGDGAGLANLSAYS